MSKATVQELLQKTAEYQQLAAQSLLSTAKKKEKKKLDPKAKVRNRGTVCVPAESAKDKKDHFPINDADQARNALARVHQYSSAPDWYKGSLQGLQALVARKVKAKYPKIDVGGKKKDKKSYVEVSDDMVRKYGQASMVDQARTALRTFLAATSAYANQGAVSVPWGQLRTLADQVEAGGQQARAVLPRILPLMTQIGTALTQLGVHDTSAIDKAAGDFRRALLAATTQGQPTRYVELDEEPDTGEYGVKAPAEPEARTYRATTTTEGLSAKAIQQALFNWYAGTNPAILGTTGPERNGVDGDWGQKSEAALAQFRRDKGIPANVPSKTVKEYLLQGAAGPVPGTGQPTGQFGAGF
jgi:hypothetical protein